jgi:hypothetical protein
MLKLDANQVKERTVTATVPKRNLRVSASSEPAPLQVGHR